MRLKACVVESGGYRSDWNWNDLQSDEGDHADTARVLYGI